MADEHKVLESQKSDVDSVLGLDKGALTLDELHEQTANLIKLYGGDTTVAYCQDYDWSWLELKWYRDETLEERAKREQLEKARKARAKAAREKQKNRELREYERLKKKYG